MALILYMYIKIGKYGKYLKNKTLIAINHDS